MVRLGEKQSADLNLHSDCSFFFKNIWTFKEKYFRIHYESAVHEFRRHWREDKEKHLRFFFFLNASSKWLNWVREGGGNKRKKLALVDISSPLNIYQLFISVGLRAFICFWLYLSKGCSKVVKAPLVFSLSGLYPNGMYCLSSHCRFCSYGDSWLSFSFLL